MELKERGIKITKKDTNLKGSLSWGSTTVPRKTNRNLIIWGWLVTLISLLRVFLLGAIAFYLSLILGIVLIRSKERAAQINGWVITIFFAFRFVLMLLFSFRIITL